MKKADYPSAEACRKCNGVCCKALPGMAVPEDFGGDLLESLTKAFKTGKWAIDWWEGDLPVEYNGDRGYHVRPKVKNVDNLFDPSCGGVCTFFTSGAGCSLSLLDRPAVCRSLELIDGSTCNQHGADKEWASVLWVPYHDEILKAAKDCGELPPEDLPLEDALMSALSMRAPLFTRQADGTIVMASPQLTWKEDNESIW